MTQARRLMVASAITIVAALALFAVVANTGAFNSSDASSAPPVDISVDGTAFVADEPGQGIVSSQQTQVNDDEGGVDDDARQGDEHDGDHDSAERKEHEEHDDDD